MNYELRFFNLTGFKNLLGFSQTAKHSISPRYGMFNWAGR
jgi:hypothetical protein